MKIDLKDKKTRVSLIIVAIILVPILFNQGKGLIMGVLSAYQMSLPKNVEVASPVEKEIEYAVASTREKHKIASMNPDKIPIVKEIIDKCPNDKILVIGQYLQQLDEIIQRQISLSQPRLLLNKTLTK